MTWAPCPHGVRTRGKKGIVWHPNVLSILAHAERRAWGQQCPAKSGCDQMANVLTQNLSPKRAKNAHPGCRAKRDAPAQLARLARQGWKTLPIRF